MSGRTFAVGVLLLGAFLIACSGKTPTTPTSTVTTAPPGTTSITVVSGETSAPVYGAGVTAGDLFGNTNPSGVVVLNGVVPNGTMVHVAVLGFLERRAPYTGEPIRLWPHRVGFAAEYSKAIAYTPDTEDLVRLTQSVRLDLSSDMDGDSDIVAAAEAAIGILNRPLGALGEKTIRFDRRAGSLVAPVVIDPGIGTTGVQARCTVAATTGVIDQVEIRFVSADAAKSALIWVHELGHALGFQDVARPYGGVMAGQPPSQGAIAGTEIVALKLMLLRRPCNHYPDNDPSVAEASGASSCLGRRTYTFEDTFEP